MKELLKNKKAIIYISMALVIVIGIISIFALKFNYTLMYKEHTQIKVYLGKDYNLQDIKNIAEETLETKQIVYQEVETFHDTIAINVVDANEEQIKALETKLKEKYEIAEGEQILQTNNVAHLKGIDIIKPYIVPVVATTIVVLAYIAIRYYKLGVLNTILTMLVRLIFAEALLLSVIAIFRIPIGLWTIPVAIFIYMIVVICTTIQYQCKSEKNIEKIKKK